MPKTQDTRHNAMRVSLITPEQTRQLRHLVLWPHIEKEVDCIIDIDHRDDAFHLGVFLDNEIIAVGSLFQMNSPKLQHEEQYRLRAMATHPEHRGTGSGRLLIEKAIRLLKEKNQDVLWCDARIKAVGFYQSLGFSVVDEVYDVPGIGPHKFMWIEL